ncbi:MAG: YceI family protein [Pseudomonadota bacterium]
MLNKLIISSIALLMPISSYAAADKYDFDKSHTHIIFQINHLGFSNTIGRIKEYDGYFTFDEKEPAKSEVNVTLNPASIDTSVAALDKELQSEKFFNTTKFPNMTFKSSKVIPTGKNTGDVTGDFTLLGVTKPVVLHVTYNKSGIHPYTNNYVSGFSAETTIKRSDFGMSSFLPAVGDEVKIHIEVEGTDTLKHPGNVKTPN